MTGCVWSSPRRLGVGRIDVAGIKRMLVAPASNSDPLSHTAAVRERGWAAMARSTSVPRNTDGTATDVHPARRAVMSAR